MLRAAGGLALAGLSWGLFESQWIERRTVEVTLERLPPALDGLRVLHLSDLHLGSVSLNGRSLERAAAWAETLDLDLVVVTGDLLARQRGEPRLMEALWRLRPRFGTFAVLGNVDVADTRDPFSTGAELSTLAPHARLLADESVTLEVAGHTVQLVGCAVTSRYRPPAGLAEPDADLRILIAHFPDTVDRLRYGAFDLVLAGHTHDGQICVPYPGGKVRLAGYNPYPAGQFTLPQCMLVVSRGTGTTFVPFRFASRPEASVLVLRRRA